MDNIILQEIRIARDDNYNMLIEIDPTENANYFYDPYFKVYLSKNYRSEIKIGVSRISILRPEYIIHKMVYIPHKKVAKNISLTKTQIGVMIKILNELNHNNSNSPTNWQYMCNQITLIAKSSGYKNIDYTKLEMPNYLELP